MLTVIVVLWLLTALGWWLDINGRHLGSTVSRALAGGVLTLVADVIGGTPRSEVFPSEVTSGRRFGVGRWHIYWRMPGNPWTFTVWVETDDTPYQKVRPPTRDDEPQRPVRNLEFSEAESDVEDPDVFTFTVEASDPDAETAQTR